LREEEAKEERNCPLQMKKSLTKKERLKKASEIQWVFSGKQSVSCYGMKLLYRNNDLSWNRMTCIPARKFGNAVERNRLKRHVREIFRQEKPRLKTGRDMVFVVYPGKAYDYWKRKHQIEKLFEKAHLYRDDAVQ